MPIAAVTDSGDRRITKLCGGAPPQHEPEHLPCPRCDSTNTKFCYYNNYNFSQPRHFCKSCRRYWTHGGTLRDIPIGGGSRKNAKRSRTTASASSSSSSSAAAASSFPAFEFRHFPSSAAATPILIPIAGADSSFTSLLNTQGPAGIFGFGVGGAIGLEDVSFGLGRALWPFSGIGTDGGGGGVGGSGSGGAAANNATGGGVGSVGGVNSWQGHGGDGGGFVGGDCFSFPDLAISTANGSGLK